MSDPRFSREQALSPGQPRLLAFPQQPGTLTTSDAPLHTRLRKLVAPAFAARRMEALRPVLRVTAGDLLDEVERHGCPADLVSAFTFPFPSAVTCELLGIPRADRDKFRQWSDATISTTLRPEEAMAAHEQLVQYLTWLVGHRRREPGDDVISELVRARDQEDRLSEAELVGLGVTILVAGNESTSNELAKALYVLLTEEGRWQALCADATTVPAVVEEILRYVPASAAATFPRVATEDVMVGDVLVRAGEAVLPSLTSANRDESRFPSPQRFDVGRQRGQHVAFGHGPHYCLGAQLARIELEIALTELARRFPALRLAKTADEIPWNDASLFHGPSELAVSW